MDKTVDIFLVRGDDPEDKLVRGEFTRSRGDWNLVQLRKDFYYTAGDAIVQHHLDVMKSNGNVVQTVCSLGECDS